MYIEAYQISDNEPFQPDTSITHVQSLKNTITENINVIINNLCLIHKIDKSQLNQSSFKSIFENINNTKTQYISNLKFVTENIDLILSTIKNESKELALTDTNSKEFGIYINPDINFNDRLFVHISNNVIPDQYWQSTIQWIEI